MTRLKNHGRSNVVYNLAKGVGTEQSDSCFPVCRMPMGLVEYVTNFFSATNINSVGKHVVSYILHVYIIITLIFQVSPCPQDYRSWLETMYCQFGQKWAKLHHGPMWSVSELHGTSHQKERKTVEVYNYSSMQEETGRVVHIIIAAACITPSIIIIMMFLMQALANIPSVSESTLRRGIADSGISSIQVYNACYRIMGNVYYYIIPVLSPHRYLC